MSRRRRCPLPCAPSGRPISSLPSWWSDRSMPRGHGAHLLSILCAFWSCSCTWPSACQRSRACAWRTWRPSSVPARRRVSRSDLLKREIIHLASSEEKVQNDFLHFRESCCLLGQRQEQQHQNVLYFFFCSHISDVPLKYELYSETVTQVCLFLSRAIDE